MKIARNDYILSNRKASKLLHINTCRLQIFNSSLLVVRDTGSKDYHILFVRKGYCTVYYGDEVRKLMPNEFVFFSPNTKQEYLFPDELSESYYIHFDGSEIQELLHNLNLTEGIYKIDPNITTVNKLFESIIAEQNKTTPYAKVNSVAFLLVLLSFLSEQINDPNNHVTIIDNIVGIINSNFNKYIDFESIAKMYGHSLYRIVIAFKQQTGFTPKQFQEDLRISTAKQYLLSSKASITEISNMVGYSDPLYFSKVFKKHTGLSPKKYRN